MALESSDDEVIDDELRELNLQTAAQQSQVSPQVPVLANDRYLPNGQNTKLSQVARKQPAQLPMEV